MTPEQESNHERELREEFSLERRISLPPLPSAQPSRVIFWLRVIIWFSPGPALLLLGAGIQWLNQGVVAQYAIYPLIAFITLGCGYCDAFLSPSVRKTDGLPAMPEAVFHSIFFVILQIFFGPLCIILLGVILLFSVSIFSGLI